MRAHLFKQKSRNNAHQEQNAVIERIEIRYTGKYQNSDSEARKKFHGSLIQREICILQLYPVFWFEMYRFVRQGWLT